MATRGPILIVDDDPAIRELIALALEPHAVVHADAASSAMAHVERGGPAAVLLDHRLPDRSGLDLLADIRCARPDVPVIMMTGYGSERLCAAALKLGVWDYFPKPVDLRELVRSVERALGAGARAAGDTALGGPSVRPAAVPPAHPPDLAIQKVIALIHHRYWDRLSLPRLAREVGMSKFGLSHRFTQVMGQSFRTYLLTVRLERAKEILSERRASITEVAQTVGFSDLPRFDKLFKRHTGLTPSAYRSRYASRAAV